MLQTNLAAQVAVGSAEPHHTWDKSQAPRMPGHPSNIHNDRYESDS